VVFFIGFLHCILCCTTHSPSSLYFYSTVLYFYYVYYVYYFLYATITRSHFSMNDRLAALIFSTYCIQGEDCIISPNLTSPSKKTSVFFIIPSSLWHVGSKIWGDIWQPNRPPAGGCLSPFSLL
jgi:hypothetical protein